MECCSSPFSSRQYSGAYVKNKKKTESLRRARQQSIEGGLILGRKLSCRTKATIASQAEATATTTCDSASSTGKTARKKQ